MAYTQEIDRYPQDWRDRSRDTKRSRQRGEKVQCSCCEKFYPWDNIEVHHANYQGENDRAGVNIFPVCGSKQEPGTCHHWLHLKKQWIRESDIWHNRNTPSVLHDLQDGYERFNQHSTNAPWDSSRSYPWLGIIGTTIGLLSIGWLLSNILLKTPTRVPQRKATVTSDVNVRSGPGKSYPIAKDEKGTDLKPLKTGTTIDVYGSQLGWVEIGPDRWVAGNYTAKVAAKKQERKDVPN